MLSNDDGNVFRRACTLLLQQKGVLSRVGRKSFNVPAKVFLDSSMKTNELTLDPPHISDELRPDFARASQLSTAIPTGSSGLYPLPALEQSIEMVVLVMAPRIHQLSPGKAGACTARPAKIH